MKFRSLGTGVGQDGLALRVQAVRSVLAPAPRSSHDRFGCYAELHVQLGT